MASTNTVDMNLSKLLGIVKDGSLACCSPCCCVRHDLATEQQQMIEIMEGEVTFRKAGDGGASRK